MDYFCHAYRNLIILIILIHLIHFSHSKINFSIPQFNPADATSLLLIGDSVSSQGEIELTNPNSTCRVGQLIYNDKVPLWDSDTGRVADFTTRFSFVIDMPSPSTHRHGIAFFLAPVGFQAPLNSAGGYLGLFNTTTTDSSRTQIVSIEFDTSFSGQGWDPPYEHVGINNNSVSSSVTLPWNATSHSGQPLDAWITYNATSTNLTVFWSYTDGQNSSLSYPINLKDVLPEWVVIGFSSTTGSSIERHILQSWQFSSTLDVKDQSDGNSAKKTGLIVGLSLSACVLIALVLGFVILRKRRNGTTGENNPEATNLTSMNDDLERGAGPRRFSYKQLESATNKFSDERKLGEGGFGGVYKGYLVEQDMPIAVKKFSRKSKQGKREYITEVKIISMLRHKNLVQLIGWCHDNGEFLLVYEFMQKGSLDRHLFDKRTGLVWSLRYKIALGLASALLYLHEEGEQCVVHRDIKCSNIMLDSNFNVKLGDFGLARLMEHGIDPKTTGLAGTLGYMAPEYVSSGRASKESDVYSFGVVALEIATGRKAVSQWDEEYSHKGLVGWVWEAYGKGELLSAMDESLQMDYEAKQVECVMMVGLWCAHPDITLRPSIRQASHVLNFEAEQPTLPQKMPVLMFHAPNDDIPLLASGDPFITNTSISMGR